MKARDIMTEHVISIPPEASVVEAAEAMLAGKFAGLPVIDGKGRLVGIITEGDLLRRWETGTARRHSGFAAFKAGVERIAADYVRSHGGRVKDLMTVNVVTVEENAPLEQVVRLLEARGFKRLPVTRDGKVIGIVSRADILRAFAAASRKAPSGKQTDDEIRRALFRTYTLESWAPLDRVDIAVAKGVVDLFGSVTSEGQRKALVAAAESTRGVTKVVDHMNCVPAREELRRCS